MSGPQVWLLRPLVFVNWGIGSYPFLEVVGLLSALVLGVAWLLYPLCTAFMSHLRRQRSPFRLERRPRVSVVIATREEPAAIRRRVYDCLQGNYPADRLDVVVALDRAVAHRLAHVRAAVQGCATVVVGDGPGGKAAALNAGVRSAGGEILVFADTHQRFGRETIPRLVAALGDPEFGGVSGSLRLSQSNGGWSLAGRYWKFERWLRESEARVHSPVGVTGAVFAMRRALWQPLPTGLILDDLYTPMRIVLSGYRIGFVARACAYEERQHTAIQEYHRKVRTLTGVIQLCRWLPSVMLPIRNPIWLQFVCHKLLRLLTPYCTLALAGWTAASLARAFGAPALLGLTLLTLLLLVARISFSDPRRAGVGVGNFLVQGALLQAAVIVGTLNGLIGRWHVWRS